MVTAGLLVVTTTGVVDTGVVLCAAGVVLVLRVELLAVAHGAQPSVFALEVPDIDELGVVETDVVRDEDEDLDELVIVDDEIVVEDLVVEETVVEEMVVEELEDPHEAPALTENCVESKESH